jgi:hypothetical protein
VAGGGGREPCAGQSDSQNSFPLSGQNGVSVQILDRFVTGSSQPVSERFARFRGCLSQLMAGNGSGEYFVKYLHTDPLLWVAAMAQNGVSMQILDRFGLRSSRAVYRVFCTLPGCLSQLMAGNGSGEYFVKYLHTDPLLGFGRGCVLRLGGAGAGAVEEAAEPGVADGAVVEDEEDGEGDDDVEGELEPAVHAPGKHDFLQPEDEGVVGEIDPVGGVCEVADAGAVGACVTQEPAGDGEGAGPGVERGGGDDEGFEPERVRLAGRGPDHVADAEDGEAEEGDEEVAFAAAREFRQAMAAAVEPPAEEEKSAVVEDGAERRGEIGPFVMHEADIVVGPHEEHAEGDEQEDARGAGEEPVEAGIQRAKAACVRCPGAHPEDEAGGGAVEEEDLKKPQVTGPHEEDGPGTVCEGELLRGPQADPAGEGHEREHAEEKGQADAPGTLPDEALQPGPRPEEA